MDDMGGMNFYSASLLLSGAITLGLAGYAAQQPRIPVAKWFSWLMVAMSLYSLGYAMELMALDQSHINYWLRVQYLGIAFIPSLIMIIALTYHRHASPPPSTLSLLFGISLVTLLLHSSNQLHHLFYAHMGFDRSMGITISRLDFGPWYYVHVAYLNLSLLFSCGLFFRIWQVAPVYYKRQATLILAGSVAPWLCYLIYLVGLAPAGIDLSPFGFAITGPLYAFGLFRYRFIDLVPIARERVFEDIQDGVLVLDASRRLVDFNRAATRLFGGLSPQAIGQSLGVVCGEAGDSLERLYQVSTLQLDVDGRQIEATRDPLCNDQGHELGMAVLLRDVTERNRMLATLRKLAETDSLTGIYNRRMILELAEMVVNQARSDGYPLVLVMFDIDNFKHINDSCGHQVGDALLQAVTGSLRQRLRQDDMLGRYGGDEFMLVLPRTVLSLAMELMEQSRRQVLAQHGVGLSIGVAALHKDQTLEQLIHEADQALYRAKAGGRGRVCSQKAAGEPVLSQS